MGVPADVSGAFGVAPGVGSTDTGASAGVSTGVAAGSAGAVSSNPSWLSGWYEPNAGDTDSTRITSGLLGSSSKVDADRAGDVATAELGAGGAELGAGASATGSAGAGNAAAAKLGADAT